ncbi:hypothetical protein [Streptomyces sp. NPDC057554]|uniref:hypothetical protein n=1 Tax=Streptomyces sp. NPDC057554 TaxID=3350538 RepID=UPI0036C6246A
MRGLTGSSDGSGNGGRSEGDGVGGGPGADDGSSSGRPRRSGGFRAGMAASGTALAGLAAFGLLGVGCSTGGTGTRDEGPAGGQSVAQVSPRPVPSGTAPVTRRVNVVALVKGDPAVSEQVKDVLEPCAGKAYPVDTSYGSMTDGPSADVVVNVMSCADSVGIGTYVYRAREDGSYENVFMAEVPAVYGTIDRGDLVVTTQVYREKDPMAFPSGSEVVTYRWADGRFAEHDRVHNDFSRGLDDTDGELPAQTEPVEPDEPEERAEPDEQERSSGN